jgi:hypothetical protein
MQYTVSCDPDGHFYSPPALAAGVWNVSIAGGEGTEASREVTLTPAQLLDLGAVLPDADVIHGVVNSDFPLEGAVVYLTRAGIEHGIQLDGQGEFALVVNNADEPVSLCMWTPQYGAFTGVFPSGRATLVWDVSWNAGRERDADPSPVPRGDAVE